MIQFDEEDYKKWGIFRKSKRVTLTSREFEMVCQLHALYNRHNYYKPCTCNPRVVKGWITDLNTIWKNGVARD
tara:strand:+ start:521 stop:739 length:219 start_codon:yes stop_codon:yes gene_type:complete